MMASRADTSIRGWRSGDEAEGAREWFSPAELAELQLPGFTGDKRSINRRIADQRWNLRVDRDGTLLMRQRAGRGGGAEYHVSLLPGEARLELARRGLSGARPGPEVFDPDADAWRWFDGRSGKIKAEAERRLAAVQEVELLKESGMTGTAAVAEVAASHGIGRATLWNWLKLVDGVAPAHRLPALAPRRQGGGAEADIDPELWQLFKSDYLRPEEPPLTICYENVAHFAGQNGLSLPSERTFRRRLERDVDPGIVRRLRKGAEAARRALPAQRRTVAHLHALECVNIDGHTFDVRVQHPSKVDKHGKPLIVRPILVGIQDVRSSKMLAWRVCEVESAHYVRLVFGDLFAKWGIPVHAVLDNGRGFASKWITGGMKTRFRFKVRPEEPEGLLTGLNIKVHWALPFHGQSKPIERAWGDLTNRIARSAFVAGAYTGRSTLHKPENYGSRAVPWAEFAAHVDACIARHNAKLGRRGRDYKGRSFDDVFAESYAVSQIDKATPEQLRRAMLAADQKLVGKQDGVIEMFGNRYWSQACGRLHGTRVTVRFDPENLHGEVHVYGQDGAYLCAAQCLADEGFLTAEAAGRSGKFQSEQKRRMREGIAAEELLSSAQVASYQTGVPVEVVPEARVIRPARQRGGAAAALKVVEYATPALPSGENKILNLFGRVRPDE